MSRGPRKDPELKLAEELKRVEESLASLEEKKKNLLEPILEKEKKLKDRRNYLKTQLENKKKTDVINLIANSGLTLEELEEMINAKIAEAESKKAEEEAAATFIEE